MERLQAELAEGGREYIGVVIKESMRLRPVIIDTGRTLLEPTQLGGNLYPAGTVVTPSILLTHHRADAYPKPMEFRPERFVGQEASESLTWIPFGGGIRRALAPASRHSKWRFVIRTILHQCDLSAARSRDDTQWRRAVTFVPRHGTHVVLHRRRPQREYEVRT
jgi:cytochrome P450